MLYYCSNYKKFVMGDKSVFLSLPDQVQAFQLPLMLCAGGKEIDACRFNAGVSQHVGQLYNIPAGSVKAARKEVAQIVGKHLGSCHAGFFADRLHFRPYLLSGQLPAASGAKNRAGSGLLFLGILLQLAAQLGRKQDHPHLALERDFSPPRFHRLHRDVFHLAYPDARGTDGFQK